MGFVLSVTDLSCGYRDKPILSEVSFEVNPGDSIAILGPNGAGKSLLLKTLAGEVKPIGGKVWIRTSEQTQALDLHRLSSQEAAKAVAVVPQEEPTPFAFLVKEVVALGRLAAGTGIFDSKEDVEESTRAMEVAGCDHLALRPITELSGGEKQRVLIARAIAQRSNLLLLDEPTSHLDPSHQISIATLIASLATEGASVVTAVHDLNLASILATKAMLIANGKIALVGPVDKVLQSTKLEEAFQTRFERVRTDSGRLIVVGQR